MDDKYINQKEIDANIEYTLSIHSTKRRSRRRLHIRGKEDVITMDSPNSIIDVSNEIKSKDNVFPRDSISFSGGGYNCVYHLGVAKYIFLNSELFYNTKYLGASGGAGIISLILCYEKDSNRMEILEKIIEDIINLIGMKMQLHQQVSKYSEIIETYIDEEKFNKFIKNTNRCHISLTDVSSILPHNVIKSDFKNYSDYLSTLRASACIPYVLDDKIRNIDNRSYLDGGLSNNLPTLNKDTIRISCLNYPFMNADIYPKVISEIKFSFIPPSKNYTLNMYDLGYSGIEKYMRNFKDKLTKINAEKELNNSIYNFVNNPDNEF